MIHLPNQNANAILQVELFTFLPLLLLFTILLYLPFRGGEILLALSGHRQIQMNGIIPVLAFVLALPSINSGIVSIFPLLCCNPFA